MGSTVNPILWSLNYSKNWMFTGFSSKYNYSVLNLESFYLITFISFLFCNLFWCNYPFSSWEVGKDGVVICSSGDKKEYVDDNNGSSSVEDVKNYKVLCGFDFMLKWGLSFIDLNLISKGSFVYVFIHFSISDFSKNFLFRKEFYHSWSHMNKLLSISMWYPPKNLKSIVSSMVLLSSGRGVDVSSSKSSVIDYSKSISSKISFILNKFDSNKFNINSCFFIDGSKSLLKKEKEIGSFFEKSKGYKSSYFQWKFYDHKLRGKFFSFKVCLLRMLDDVFYNFLVKMVDICYDKESSENKSFMISVLKKLCRKCVLSGLKISEFMYFSMFFYLFFYNLLFFFYFKKMLYLYLVKYFRFNNFNIFFTFSSSSALITSKSIVKKMVFYLYSGYNMKSVLNNIKLNIFSFSNVIYGYKVMCSGKYSQKSRTLRMVESHGNVSLSSSNTFIDYYSMVLLSKKGIMNMSVVLFKSVLC